MEKLIELDGLKIWLDSHVGHVQMNLPPYNYFDYQVIDNLVAAFRTFDEMPECRATVLSAGGKAFCAGANFNQSRVYGDATSGGPEAVYKKAVELFAVKKPMVAAVHGPAIGGGLGLSLVADFRVAGQAAPFSANFTRLGIHPGFGLTFTLPRLIGDANAAKMFLTGRRFSGEQALEMGLADFLADDGEVLAEASALAAEISGNAPLAVQDTRQTLRKGFTEGVNIATTVELERQLVHFKTTDFSEGVAAAKDRRKPIFTGD